MSTILMSKNRLMGLIDSLLDDRINMYGVDNTITYLLDLGYSKEEILVDLEFDVKDVERVIGQEL